jgi:organic radical activating enzyme
VLEKMPEELKTIIEEICREGLNISIEDDGEVPVYFKDKLLFKGDVKKLIYKIISKYRDGYITRGIIFDREFEPFLAALGMELIYMLDYRLKTSLHTLPTSKLEEVLNDVEKILSEKGIRLDEDIWTGLKIANDEELAGELRKISVSDKT